MIMGNRRKLLLLIGLPLALVGIVAASLFYMLRGNGIASPFYMDALYFIEAVENTHPIFGFPDMLGDAYDDARRVFLESAARLENQQEFAFAMQRFVRVLQDGHMSMGGLWLFGEIFAAVHWDVIDDSLFLINEAGAPATEVLKIGGVPVCDIFEVINTYFFFENEADRRITRARMSRSRGIHERAGVDFNSNVLITLADGNEVILEYQIGWQLPNRRPPTYIIRHEMLGDVFYISLRAFQFNQPAHGQTLSAIRNEVNQGTQNFIVDLRGNSGGDSTVGQQILAAMGINVPHHGVYRRISPLAREQRQNLAGRVDGELWRQARPNTAAASNRNNVTVAVLTDNETYSSATMMGVWVQDGGFGVIVGEPSSNAPSSFGDMLFLTLPNTAMQTIISYSRFVRPDITADPTTLWPDIPVERHLALDAALIFFGEDPASVVPEAVDPVNIASVSDLDTDLIRYHIGVDFEINQYERVFAIPNGALISWHFLDLLGHTLDISQFQFTEVGNIFGSALGDAFLVSLDGFWFLYIDIGAGVDVSWSELHRQYSVFPLG